MILILIADKYGLIHSDFLWFHDQFSRYFVIYLAQLRS